MPKISFVSLKSLTAFSAFCCYLNSRHRKNTIILITAFVSLRLVEYFRMTEMKILCSELRNKHQSRIFQCISNSKDLSSLDTLNIFATCEGNLMTSFLLKKNKHKPLTAVLGNI